MKKIRIEIDQVKTTTIKLVANILKSGRIVVLPTDTVYGISCRADNEMTIKKIYTLKKRNFNKPFIILVSSLNMLKKYALVSSWQKSVLQKTWQENKRPTTFILNTRSRLPEKFFSSHNGLAVRLPKSIFLIKIIKTIGVPLISTSLNISGQNSFNNLFGLDKHPLVNNKEISLLLDAGPSNLIYPSRIIDLRESGKKLILRK